MPCTRPRLAAAALAVSTLLAFSLPAAAADQALIDAAKKEGTVVWYTTVIINQLVRPLADNFEKKYGVKVQYVRANASDTALKIINEARAGKVQADLFDGTSAAPPLKEAGLVAKYVPDSAKALAPQFIDKDQQWVATHAYYMTPGFNTDMVPAKDAPKTFADLLDPKWQGKMAWNSSMSSSGGPGFVGNVLTSMGDEKGMDYLKKLSAQKIINMDVSARQLLDQAIAGEFPIALQIFNHHAVISAKKGAPVSWIAMEPVTATLSVVSLTKDAQHPNAGKLLIDYMLSEDGQKLFEAADYLPVHPNVKPREPELTPEGGKFKVTVFTPETLGEKLPEWKTISDKLFR
jgi:ABC-type Fe3+ transport system substrate-binding protein